MEKPRRKIEEHAEAALKELLKGRTAVQVSDMVREVANRPMFVWRGTEAVLHEGDRAVLSEAASRLAGSVKWITTDLPSKEEAIAGEPA